MNSTRITAYVLATATETLPARAAVLAEADRLLTACIWPDRSTATPDLDSQAAPGQPFPDDSDPEEPPPTPPAQR